MSSKINAPICIASPVRRSGTTLLQRLLCSASNTLIYGETCANDVMIQINLLSTKQSFLLSSKDWRNEQLEAVLDGKVNSWIPDLMPEVDGYLDAYKNCVQSLMDSYAGFAARKGRLVWGMKLPEWNPMNLQAIQSTFPETKIIYLHRNLEDCVRSAKKIEMVIDNNELQQYCQTWKQFSDFANMHLQGEKVLHLKYEDLVAQPDKWLAEIEKFTGAEGINRSVMDVRVNTYSNDQRLEKEEETYLKPAALTAEEKVFISSFSK